MAFDPDAYLKTKASSAAKPATFNPDAYLKAKAPAAAAPVEAAPDLGVENSPLRKAMASQPGDVVTVETPDGPVQFDRKGNRVKAFGEDLEKSLTEGKEGALTRLASMFNSGGLNIAPYVEGARGALERQFDAKTSGESLGESFHAAKDKAQRTVDDADKEAGIGWQLAGKAPSMLVGGPATALGRIGLNAGLAGLEGFTRSKGHIDDEVGRAEIARDTSIAGGLGGGLGVAGEALAVPVAKTASWLAGKSATNAAKVAANDILAQTQKGRSLAGSAGAAGGEVSRAIDAVKEVLSDPNATAAELAAAKKFSSTPEFAEAVTRQRLNAMAKFPSASSNAAQFAADASEALTDVAGKAAPVTAAKLSPLNALKDFAGKAGRSLGQRALFGGLGALAGGAVGGEHGGVAGALGGGVLGGPGAIQFVRNTLKNPAYASIVQGGLAKGGSALSSALRGSSTLGRGLAPFLRDEEPAAQPKPENKADEKERAKALANLLRSSREGRSSRDTP